MEDFMKRKIVGVVYLVTVLFAFIGCSNPTSSDDYTTYKVEVEGYNKSSVLKHPKIQLKEQKDETV